MDFTLPKSAYVNKFIAKNKFFGKTLVNSKIKNEFSDKIQRITWLYKLSEDTIGVKKNDKVEEIQIFEIVLKQKIIPKNLLKIINKSVQYPILFRFIYKDSFAYSILLKNENMQKYYYSEWDEDMVFDFNALTLEKVYQNIIKKFVRDIDTDNNKFDEVIAKDQKIKSLEVEIQKLKGKIKREKQFNKKVELNKLIHLKQQELKELK